LTANQRVGAYGICRDAAGRFLLVRASARSTVPGRWFLPGGGVEHGEEPLDSLGRELFEETGLVLHAATLRGVLTDTLTRPGGEPVHAIRLVYAVERWEGEVRPEADGSSDEATWFAPDAVPRLAMPYVVEALERFS
jgi:ADP-ribose pyrophosphatase YjhB (NUDIX family)